MCNLISCIVAVSGTSVRLSGERHTSVMCTYMFLAQSKNVLSVSLNKTVASFLSYTIITIVGSEMRIGYSRKEVVVTIFRAGFGTGQAQQLPRGLHNQGASTYVLLHFIVWYSRVGWASTAPLLKVSQGPPQLHY